MKTLRLPTIRRGTDTGERKLLDESQTPQGRERGLINERAFFDGSYEWHLPLARGRNRPEAVIWKYIL